MNTKKPQKITRKKRANKRRTTKSALLLPKTAKKTPKATPIMANSKDFDKLRVEWYKRLASEGFKDIEADSNGLTNPALLQTRPTTALKKLYNSETLHYYRQWSCYLAHNETPLDEWGNIISRRQFRILSLHAEGVSYRDIIEQLKSTTGPKLTTFSISKFITAQRRLCVIWNKTNPRGLDFTPDIGLNY